MASFDALPTFDPALDPSMSFDWQGLLAQPSDTPSLPGPTYGHTTTSNDLYPTFYNLPVASSQVVGAFGQAISSASYPYHTVTYA